MRKHNLYQNRKYPILILFFCCFLAIIIKLFFIQVVNTEYKLSAENNIIRKIIKYPERGWVFDRNNNLLVSNEIENDIMVVPYQLEKNMDTLFLCDLFNLSKSDFAKKIQKSKKLSYYKPSVFLKNLSKKSFGDIQEHLHLCKGFYAQPKYIRDYNTNSGGNIFGYTSQVSKKELRQHKQYNQGDLIGVSGIEKMYEDVLKGKKGVERKIVDVFGKYQGKFEEGKYDTIAKKGNDITLTIDIDLQEYAEKLMNNKRGSIVAIEPKSGEILCLLSSPTYDPSLFIGVNRSKNFRNLFLNSSKPLYNRATSALYPPGSIFKLINALIGLQEKKITPATQFNCKSGWNYKSILHIGCHKHGSPLNLRQAIAQSCNAYFCSTFEKIIGSKKLAPKKLNNWEKHTRSFGLNNFFENDLYNKKSGFIPNSDYYNKLYGKKRWGASTCISLAIGQDAILMTPLQMANVAVIIANHGYYKNPHIIKRINNGTKEINPNFIKKKYCSIDSKYFKPVIYGMQTAIDGKYGTAKLAKLDEINICGKTGTAENPHGDDHSIFIGFAPKENPEIAIAVYVENGGWGSDFAAPIASLCIEKYINRIINRAELENQVMTTYINY